MHVRPTPASSMRAGSPAERKRLADEYATTVRIPDRDVDGAEVANIVQSAAAARNGWKVILARCALKKRGNHADGGS
jgi:hypothetical protein